MSNSNQKSKLYVRDGNSYYYLIVSESFQVNIERMFKLALEMKW